MLQVKSLEEEINQEKEEVRKSKVTQETTVKKLKLELSSSKQKLQETEVQCACPTELFSNK